MRKKVFLFGAVLLGASLATMLSVKVAFADILQPQGQWSVGNIPAAEGLPGRFCSMKNIYSGGVYLVFARDAANTNSLALEFPADGYLQAGSEYQVGIEVDGFVRSVMAQATSARVAVLQLGNDAPLFRLLAQKDRMNLDFGGVSYSFGLKGTAQAFRALDKCAGVRSGGGYIGGLPPVFSDMPLASQPVIQPMVRPDLKSMVKVTRGDEVVETGEQDTGQMTSARLQLERLAAENKALRLENEAIAAKLEAENLHKLEIQKVAEEQARAELNQKYAANQERLLREKEALKTALTEKDSIIEEQNDEIAAVKAAAAEFQKQKLLQRQVPKASTGIPVTLSSLLSVSGVAIKNTNGRSYVWEQNGLFGSAEDLGQVSERILSDKVSGFINAASEKCGGDFADRKSDPFKIGGFSVVEAEIACIDGQNDVIAALLFFVLQDGRLNVVMNEGDTGSAAQVLQARSQMVKVLADLSGDEKGIDTLSSR